MMELIILLFKISKTVLYILIPFAALITISNLEFQQTYLVEIITLYTILIIVPALILLIPQYIDKFNLRTTKISILLFKTSAWLFPISLLLIKLNILNSIQTKNFLSLILIIIVLTSLSASILSFYSFWIYKKQVRNN